MKYLDKRFSSPANSASYVANWEATFGDDEDEVVQPCGRCADEGRTEMHDPRNCTLPRPWSCLCYARMAGECLCGAWDDVR